MNKTRTCAVASVALAILSLGAPIYSLHAAQTDGSKPVDNSAQNKNQGTTADKQTNARADRETTAQVRKAIIADKELSTYAHNVKILVFNGAVTLKGPVKTEDEKQKVATDAASVVSADKVANQLTVKR